MPAKGSGAALLGGLRGDPLPAFRLAGAVLFGQARHAAGHGHRHDGVYPRFRAFLHDKVHLVRLGQALQQGHPHARLRRGQGGQQLRRDPVLRGQDAGGIDFFLQDDLDAVPVLKAQHGQRVPGFLGQQPGLIFTQALCEKSVHGFFLPPG